MNPTETFFLHGEIDVTPILKIIEDNNLNWDEYTARQKKYNSDHAFTKTIPIIFDKSLNFNHTKIMPTEYYPLFEKELNFLEEKIKLSTNENGKIMRALLVKLAAKKSIVPHVDWGVSFKICRRIHVPIQTNEGCFFIVGDDRRHLKKGELWEINNDKKMHSVENNGDEDRIHLIVDWIEEKFLQS
jgi:hypothetical protein